MPWISTFELNSKESAPIINPEPQKSEEIADSELKDYQYIRKDFIGFLIHRTNILIRLNYMLTDFGYLLNEQGVLGILKILVRIARHSPNELAETPELLSNILKYFMNSNISNLLNSGKSNFFKSKIKIIICIFL